MSIKLIIHGREQSNISQDAKKWFYERVLNGKPGAFTCATISNKTKAILLVEPKNPQQMELFQ